jgi:8-oxo-dGTP diphosphatase
MEPERIGVCIIVVDKENRVLLGKRINSYKAGMLGMPGGRLEFDETLESCGERELKEETSLQSKSLTYLGTIRELQEDHNFIHFAYLCNQYEGVPVTAEPDKCAGWEWYPLDILPENILPGHKAAIEMYIKKETLIELLEKE